jgi:hypothetical protein
VNLRDQNPRMESKRPWGSREEFLVDQALAAALAGTPEEIRAMRPVAAPQQPFPDRLGFRQQTWTVTEVLNVDRYTPSYRSWLSGMPVRPSVMSDQSWSGTARNALSEGTW